MGPLASDCNKWLIPQIVITLSDFQCILNGELESQNFTWCKKLKLLLLLDTPSSNLSFPPSISHEDDKNNVIFFCLRKVVCIQKNNNEVEFFPLFPEFFCIWHKHALDMPFIPEQWICLYTHMYTYIFLIFIVKPRKIRECKFLIHFTNKST